MSNLSKLILDQHHHYHHHQGGDAHHKPQHAAHHAALVKGGQLGQSLLHHLHQKRHQGYPLHHHLDHLDDQTWTSFPTTSLLICPEIFSICSSIFVWYLCCTTGNIVKGILLEKIRDIQK